MPEIIPGYPTEQKVISVPNNDEDINAEIETQGSDSWLVSSMFINGSNMTILFTRTIAAA